MVNYTTFVPTNSCTWPPPLFFFSYIIIFKAAPRPEPAGSIICARIRPHSETRSVTGASLKRFRPLCDRGSRSNQKAPPAGLSQDNCASSQRAFGAPLYLFSASVRRACHKDQGQTPGARITFLHITGLSGRKVNERIPKRMDYLFYKPSLTVHQPRPVLPCL